MYNKKRDKLFYISISAVLLLLLVIIGALVYNTSPENGAKKDQNTENSSPSSLTNNDERKSADSLDTQPPRLSTANVNNIGNAVLLGIFGWLSSDYTKQLAADLVQNANNKENELTFKLSRPHYILAGVVAAAMVVYIGYFFYQKYRVHEVPSYSLRNDVVIFALTSFLTSVFFYPAIAEQLEQAAQGQEALTQTLLGKIIMSFIGRACVYVLTIACIASVKSNHKIKVFGPEGFIMWLFSILMLTSIQTIMHLSTAYTIRAQLLWAIPACFLYVQAYSNVSIPSLGNETIDKMIAHFSQTSYLWEGLMWGCMVYHFGHPLSKVIASCIVWEVAKYALSHLDIKKISDAAGYTASFPLSFTALLEGSFMILFVAFGLSYQFWPDVLATLWTKIAYGASVLAIGLLISLYCTAHKSSMAQWGGLLSYGLLTIGGSVMAGYYIIWGGNAQNISLAIAPASLLVFGLYLVPKFLNRLAAASLTLKNMPEMMRKIANTTQGFTSFWLQPNLEVLLAGMVMGVGLHFWYLDIAESFSKELQLTLIILIIGLGLGLGLYALLQVYFYNKALLAEKKRALISHGWLGLYLGLLALCIEAIGRSVDLKELLTFGVTYLICYVIVVLVVEVLLDIVAPKDYKRTYLPLAKWKEKVTHAFRRDNINKWPSMRKYLGSALAIIKQYAICCLSVLFVGYCLYKREGRATLLSMSGLFVGLLYIFPKFMQLVATISLTRTRMPASLQKLARAIQHPTAFWLQPDLDVILCGAVVMGLGCIYEYGDKGDMRSAQYSQVLRSIGIIYLLSLAGYLMIEVWCYHLPRQEKRAGYLEFFVFGCTLAYIVELLATSGEDKMKCFLRSLYCVFCYLGIVVWIQSLLNIVGLKGYRKAAILPSLTGKDMYAIALGFCNVLIQIGGIHWLLARDHDYVPLPMLLLVFAVGAYISLVKLFQPLIKHRASIVSCSMAVAYYAYATGFLCNDETLPTWFPENPPFCQLSVVGLGLCAAIMVTYIQNIGVYVWNNFTLAKIKGMLHSGYTSVCKFFLRILVFLKGLFSTDVTSSTLSTDVVAEEITAAKVDPLYENIKITLVKNFPALFGMGMILLYNKYLISAGKNNPISPTYWLVMAGTVCGLALLYTNVVLSEFDKKVAKIIFSSELVRSLIVMLAIIYTKWAIFFSSSPTIPAVGVFVLGSIIVYYQRDLFYKKDLHKWCEKLSGLTLLTCLTALHMGYLFFTNFTISWNSPDFIAACIICYFSSYIVLVSMFDTLQLSSAAKTDTWEKWFATYFCTYCPVILSASYVIGFYIWQTPILTSSKHKVACSLLFLLLFSGFKQLRVTAQEGGKLRFSPIAIDHNLLAQDLFMAFLLPFFYYVSKNGLESLSQVSYQDIAMSVLCTIVVRWGLCNGLITHLTKKQAERSSKQGAHPKQASMLWLRRTVHSILVVACWLLIKKEEIYQITANYLLMVGVVALPSLSTYSKGITSIFDIKYIKQAMAFFYDVFYQNQIATFLILAWLQTQLFVSDTLLGSSIPGISVALALQSIGIVKVLRIALICTIVACLVLVKKMITKENNTKIATHFIFWLFGLKFLMPAYKQAESSTYLLNICYLVVALAVEGLHRLPLRGKINDIKHGVLTQMNKHHLLLGALYGLGIAIAPGIHNGNLNLFNYKTLICVMVGVLIGFVGAVYGEKIAVWLGQQDRIAWIQGFCIFVSTAIAIRIQLGIATDENSLITNKDNFLTVLIPVTILCLYYSCVLFMAKQQKPLCWLFRWSRADALVDYVPLVSLNEHKS